MSKVEKMKTPYSEIKTMYTMNVFLQAKEEFQEIAKEENKTTGELFREMVKTYRESKRPAA